MKRIIIITMAMVFGFVSCDILDTVPSSTLSRENYFKTETDLQLFSNTFYNNLLDKSPYDNQSDHQTENTLSDEMTGGTDRSVPASGGGWSWGDLRKMNTLLASIGQCEDKAAVDKYTGLTKFFRAYFYFVKVARFGDVPWIDVELESDDEALYYPRDSREVILGHMIEDIDEAIEKLPADVSCYRVNKWTALALKAQFCLFEGTFRKYHSNDDFSVSGKEPSYFLQLAADAAAQVMASGKYSLVQDYRMLFAAPDADPKEYMLAIKNDFSLAIFNNSTYYAISQSSPGVTKKFVDSFLMKDGSRFTDREGWQTMQFAQEVADRDPRLGWIIRTPGYMRIGGTEVLPPVFTEANTGYQFSKYVMDCTLEGVDRVSRSYNDMPVFRYAEVLLTYAEAKAELGTLTQDDLNKSVNLIRSRAGMPDMTLSGLTVDPYLTSPEFGYTNPALLADAHCAEIVEIRRERSIELALEGRRWNDLMRWGEGKCIEQPIYGMYFPEPEYIYDKDGKHYEYGEYDLDGDGVKEYCLWSGTKPSTKAKYILKVGFGGDIVLTEGNHGNVIKQVVEDKGSTLGFKEITRSFNVKRDYLYPLPQEDLALNTSLKQNPGWN